MSALWAGMASRWILPPMALISSVAHFWLAAESSGVMAVLMLISGLLCFGCAVHSIFGRHQRKSQAMVLLVMSAIGAVVHMCLITAHYAAGGHRHGVEFQQAADPGHMLQMLALVGYELVLVALSALVVRGLSEQSEAIIPTSRNEALGSGGLPESLVLVAERI